MKKTMSGALLALICTGSLAQIFGPPATPELPAPIAQPVAPVLPSTPRPAAGSKNGPPAATDFRSVAMACANTGKESKEAFDACMKSSTISQPGVTKAMQDSLLVPTRGPVYASPLTPPSPTEPGNLFATPEKKLP